MHEEKARALRRRAGLRRWRIRFVSSFPETVNPRLKFCQLDDSNQFREWLDCTLKLESLENGMQGLPHSAPPKVVSRLSNSNCYNR